MTTRAAEAEWPETAYQVAATAIADQLGDEVGCASTCARIALDSVLPYVRQELEFAYYVGGEAARMEANDG